MSVCNSSTTVSVAPWKPCLPPLPAITSLDAIMLDFDPDRFHPELAAAEVLANPKKMWKKLVGIWLSRHPIFAKAQVVSTGRGLHVIIRFSEPLQFETTNDRSKWAAVVKIVQKLLPTDPDCPGITALTRPVGSVSGENGARVALVRGGEPVSPAEVLAFCVEALAKPFSTTLRLLLNRVRIKPCPICRIKGSRLQAFDHEGRCNGRCGDVTLGQIRDLFLKTRSAGKGDKKARR